MVLVRYKLMIVHTDRLSAPSALNRGPIESDVSLRRHSTDYKCYKIAYFGYISGGNDIESSQRKQPQQSFSRAIPLSVPI